MKVLGIGMGYDMFNATETPGGFYISNTNYTPHLIGSSYFATPVTAIKALTFPGTNDTCFRHA